MKKRLSSFALALLMALEIPLSASAAGGFTDVPDGKWYTNAIVHCVEHKYMSGVGGNEFDPNGGVSRAMVAQVLWNMSGKTEPTTQNPFTDVSNQWFAKAVIWAYENKITSGTSSTTFSPNANVTREQLCTLVMNWKKLDTSFTFDDDEVWLSNFSDKNNISGFAKKAMIWGYQTGFISGTSSTELSPKQGATRAQLAQFLYNLDNPKLRDKPDPSEEPDPIQPAGGKNTSWTAELAPIQIPSVKRVRDGKTFWAPSENYWNPSETTDRPVEWIVAPRYEVGGNTVPYFDASTKDIQPVPADGVKNTGDPYWTMIGLIPHGGYVENSRIYLDIARADDDWITDCFTEDGWKSAPEYAWRIDVTSVDGKMTEDEKWALEEMNRWRAEKNVAPLVYDEWVQIQAEAAALIEHAENKAREAAYKEFNLTAPRGADPLCKWEATWNGSLHSLMPNPAIKNESGTVTFKKNISVKTVVRLAYACHTDRPLGENMYWATGYTAKQMMNSYRGSNGHYAQATTSYWTTAGVASIHTGQNAIVANCCLFDYKSSVTDPDFFTD